MGMYGHLVAVDPQDATLVEPVDDSALGELLRGPDAASIDKSWEAVFPLIGSIAGTGMMLVDDPLPVGGDVGFGPAMFIDADTSAAIHVRLASADGAVVAEHWARLDSPFMSHGSYDDDFGKEFAMDGYRKAVAVFASAAAARYGVLFAIM